MSLQKDRQFLPVPPEISERVVVVQLDIRVHDFFNCVRHGFPVPSRWVQTAAMQLIVSGETRFVARAGFKVVSSARRNGFVPLIAVRGATAP